MNVIWKERKNAPASAGIDVVFQPKDIVSDLEQPIMVEITIKRCGRAKKEK